MPNYRRVRIAGGTYFFTVTLADRASTLLVDRIIDLGVAFRTARATRPFTIDAIVVLPDHLHAVWTLPHGDDDYPNRWAHIKAMFTRRVGATAKPARASLRRKRERGVWQRRYWARAILDERDLAAHIDYVHINPVKHQFAERAADWRWSSFHRFVREGRIDASWADGGLKPTLCLDRTRK